MYDTPAELQKPRSRPTTGTELTELQITTNSLVPAGANETDLHVLKGEDMSTKTQKMDEFGMAALQAAEAITGNLPEQLAGLAEGDSTALASWASDVSAKFQRVADMAEMATPEEAPAAEPEAEMDGEEEFEMAKTIKALGNRVTELEAKFTGALETIETNKSSIGNREQELQAVWAKVQDIINSMKGAEQ